MNYDDFILCSHDAYPEITDATPDIRTANILRDLANGRAGEFTAISQYTYQHIFAHDQAKEISKILEEISISEMKHLELLSEAIMKFGGKPVFIDSRGQYFSTSFVNYPTRLIDMLRANIKGETQAIIDYERAIAKVENASLKQLLQRIVQDEKCHLKVFEDLESTVDFFSN